MKRLFILLIILSSCKGVRSLSNQGCIKQVDKSKGVVLIEFECEQLPFKNQPCFGADYFDLKYFPNAKEGQKVIIK